MDNGYVDAEVWFSYAAIAEVGQADPCRYPPMVSGIELSCDARDIGDVQMWAYGIVFTIEDGVVFSGQIGYAQVVPNEKFKGISSEKGQAYMRR